MGLTGYTVPMLAPRHMAANGPSITGVRMSVYKKPSTSGQGEGAVRLGRELVRQLRWQEGDYIDIQFHQDRRSFLASRTAHPGTSSCRLSNSQSAARTDGSKKFVFGLRRIEPNIANFLANKMRPGGFDLAHQITSEGLIVRIAEDA